LQAVAALLPPDETQLMYSLALHGRAELGLAPDEYAGLTMVLLRLLTFRPPGAVSVRRAAAGVSGAVSGAVSGVVPGRAAAVVVAPAAAPTAAQTSPQATRKDLLRPARPAMSVPAPAPAPVVAAMPTPAAAPRPALVRPPALARVESAGAASVPPWEDIPAVDLDAPSASRAPAVPLDGAHGGGDTGFDAPVAASASASTGLAATSPAPDVAAEPCQDAWVDAVRQVLAAGALTALARELALQSQCIAYQPTGADGSAARWLLRVERESLRQAGHLERLTKALRECGADPAASVELEAGPVVDCVARRDAEAKARRQVRAEAAFSSDERVVNLLARYPTARVVPGSVRPPA
jgi:DNA polymerase-3 subunit gamma/tau